MLPILTSEVTHKLTRSTSQITKHVWKQPPIKTIHFLRHCWQVLKVVHQLIWGALFFKIQVFFFSWIVGKVVNLYKALDYKSLYIWVIFFLLGIFQNVTISLEILLTNFLIIWKKRRRALNRLRDFCYVFLVCFRLQILEFFHFQFHQIHLVS